MYRTEYYKTLPSSQWMTHYLKLHQQHESAHSMLKAHHLRGWRLALSDVDETGKLPVARFFPGSRDNSAFDPRICRAFETNTFIKEDLLAYYKFLFDMMFLSFYRHTSTLPSPLDKAAPFQLSHPETNLPVYSLPSWNKFVFAVNGTDTTVEDTGIRLTLLPNMTIRCCIPTPQIPTFSISERIRLSKQSGTTLFATWACQANCLIHGLPINIMDLQTELWLTRPWIECAAEPINGWRKDTASPAAHKLLEREMLHLFYPWNSMGNVYWSQDEQGQDIIEDSLIQATFGITIPYYWDALVYPIPPQFYQILRTIHQACGFDPYSTEVAEYLGLPLAVADSGHLGLEEYVEDPEYPSESESGDSDYVSASEDA
ncbi:hypothetical protein C8J56DRAFT_1050946 [Mycena floridula]|nr:hypothetical protein C8J56DRAFT_1050946 [Mycena floridula]